MRLDAVIDQHCFPDRRQQLFQIAPLLPLHLLDHDQRVFLLDLHHEGCSAAGLHGRIAVLRRQFDVLRIKVPPPQDNQVF
jgi:hypothetical protein